LSTATNGEICVESKLHCDPARLTPAESGKAAAAGGNPG
jgi:hypothetical protein